MVNQAIKLSENSAQSANKTVTFGICAACDPRVEAEARERTQNIIGMLADEICKRVTLPDGEPVKVVYSTVLIDGERQADYVARQFMDAGVDAIICTPDTWAFPQLSLMSLMAHFPENMPLNITCGNSAPKPGVVFAHAVNGAFAQAGRLTHLNVGNWEDTGMHPKVSPETLEAMTDWCFAALTFVGLKGRRILCFGHDSMGMETALTHVNATRSTFGLEVARLDMKLLSDMLNKKAYNQKELKQLRAWVMEHLGTRVDLSQTNGSEKLDQSLATYLLMRDLLDEHNAVAGAFMNQLEWGSDHRGIPLPICDFGESLFNSTFDHNGPKAAIPFGTEADMQGVLTMLFSNWLTGGNPPLFMDFRKVWDADELLAKAKDLGISIEEDAPWTTKGIVDGDNSGSASLNWAAKPGAAVDEIMSKISMPGAELHYFPGGGNSVSFVSPGGIDGIAGRLAYSELTGMFSLIWDEATTVDLPGPLADFVANSSTVTWPHTWVMPKYATMTEYKQYAPANHFHMIWDLKPSTLQYWMDLANVLSVVPWQARPSFIEGCDRPMPLMHLINGGENNAKRIRQKGF